MIPRNLEHPLQVGLSFGLVSGAITCLGLVVGLGFGTESIPRVRKIVGPGSPAVTIAQVEMQRHGVTTMMLLGPTESLLIADDTADPVRVAADLLIEAEHGENSCALLVTHDRTEARALRELFGQRCDDLPVTGLKSMTGHAIAASGPLETVAALKSLQEGLLAPTINYETPDPECNVDVVANKPRERSVGTCVKLSYGFGGHNACLVLLRD